MLAAALVKHLNLVPAERERVDAIFEDFLRQSERSWPRVAFEPAAFAEWIASKLPPGGKGVETLGRLHGVDLYLTGAFARGVSGAAETLTERITQLHNAVGLSHSVDDLLQELLLRVLVPRSDAPARIFEYSGQGSLENWVRVAMARLLINLTAKKQEEPLGDEDMIAELVDSEGTPEFRLLLSQFRPQFKEAFRQAFRGLEAPQRLLMRQRFLDGLSLEELCRAHQFSRATASRRLLEAREHTLALVRTSLRDVLKVSEEEFESVVRALLEQLDISLRALAES